MTTKLKGRGGGGLSYGLTSGQTTSCGTFFAASLIHILADCNGLGSRGTRRSRRGSTTTSRPSGPSHTRVMFIELSQADPKHSMSININNTKNA